MFVSFVIPYSIYKIHCGFRSRICHNHIRRACLLLFMFVVLVASQQVEVGRRSATYANDDPYRSSFSVLVWFFFFRDELDTLDLCVGVDGWLLGNVDCRCVFIIITNHDCTFYWIFENAPPTFCFWSIRLGTTLAVFTDKVTCLADAAVCRRRGVALDNTSATAFHR